MPESKENQYISSPVFRVSRIQILLLVCCCIPLYFINIKNSHDWGDDFAQYLHQAENIVHGKPPYDTGYLYNERYPFLGPPAYPPGFPLLLAPLTPFAGKQILPYAYLITSFLVLFAITIFIFFSSKMESWKAFTLALILIYNPWFLYFKSEVVSDLPFSFFLLLAIILFTRRKQQISFILLFGLLIGFLVCIRWVGLVLPITLGFYLMFRFVKERNKEVKGDFINFGIIVPAISLTFYVLMNYIFFPVNAPRSVGNNQLQILFQSVSLQSIQTNISNYSELIKNFFCFSSQEIWSIAGRIGGYILLISSIIGLAMSFINKPTLKDWFFLFYLSLLIIYPYGSSGLRFLIPLLPFMFLYAYDVYKLIPLSRNYGKAGFLLLIISIFFIYRSETKKIIREHNITIWGPQRFEAVDMFSFINKNTLPSDHILFIKPRALSFYTDRAAFANYPKEEQEIFKEQLSNFNIHYLLDDKEIPNPALTEFLKDSSTYISVYQSDPFFLYKLK